MDDKSGNCSAGLLYGLINHVRKANDGSESNLSCPERGL